MFRNGFLLRVIFTQIKNKYCFYESDDDKYDSDFIHMIEIPDYEINTIIWDQHSYTNHETLNTKQQTFSKEFIIGMFLFFIIIIYY